MMTSEEYAKIREEVASQRNKMLKSNFGLIPASIGYLENLLDNTSEKDDKAVLYSLIFSECSRAKNDQLYIDWLRRGVQEFSEDPQFYIDLAFGLAVTEPRQRDESLATAYKALELAKLQDRMVRYCATSLARIALMLDSYEMLNRALDELVADSGNSRIEDSNYEFDFVDQIDTKRIDTKLLEQYIALAGISNN